MVLKWHLFLQRTSVIGNMVAKVMVVTENYRIVEFNIAGDYLTYGQATVIFAKVTGTKKLPAAYKYLTSALVAMKKDLKQMVVFNKEKGTGATVDSELMD